MARKKRTLPRSVKGESKTLSSFQQLQKQDTHLIGPVARHLLAQEAKPSTRRKDVIHPSELCKPDWCNRRSFYRLTLVPESDAEQEIGYGMLRIFEEGHFIHDKWQSWLWDIGTLQGLFECLHCSWKEWAVAPEACPECGQLRWGLRYREVPVVDKRLRIHGSADAMTDEPVEIKSIGLGTVRWEAPDLIRRYDSGELTLDGLWRAIKRPFPSHIKQGMFYAHILGRTTIRYIYEWKANQDVREFTLKVNTSIIEAMLDNAEDVAYAVRTGRVPSRPHWADEGPDSSHCKTCTYRTHCWSNNRATPTTVRSIRRKKSS